MIKHIVLALTFAAVCASVQAGAYKDGTYIGEGNGNGNASRIQVEVVVSGGKIASVNVLKHGETEPLLKAAQKKLSKAIVKKNGTDGVAAVSGASNSSRGIIEAVNKALEKAK